MRYIFRFLGTLGRFGFRLFNQPKPDPPNFINKLKNFFQNPNQFPGAKRGIIVGGVGLMLYYIFESLILDGSAMDLKEFNQRMNLEMIDEITIVRTQTGQVSDLKVRVKSQGKRFNFSILDQKNFREHVQRMQQVKGKSRQQQIPVYFCVQKSLEIKLKVCFSFFIFASFIYLQFKSNLLNFGMNFKVKQFSQELKVNTRFKDVAGLDQAKIQVTQFVDFLRNPLKYSELGARIPKGALLSGPPGTGKTMLAKACAGQAQVPFFYMSGSDFVQMFVGLGASRVRDLFKLAKQKAPSIIFIDQIDAVGRKREGKLGGNDQKDNTLNQLLVQMDGFGTNSNVVVLAATNRKQLLDSALTRPGRFDRSIDVVLPDLQGRKQIFLVHLRPLLLDPSRTMQEYAKRLATLTPGFSGAQISNLCNQAAILAARLSKKYVQPIDFQNASDRILAGVQRKKIVTEQQRKVTAFHESGHAVVSWFLQGASPLLKLTIVPRSKGSLGFAQYLPSQSSLQTKQQLLDKICFILGGRCAEQFFFKRITTGAYDDLGKAFQIAYNLVVKLGMSDKIGFIGFKDPQYTKTFSQDTNKKIDDQIKRIIDQCTQKTRRMIKEYEGQITKLAESLLEKETLDSREIRKILGQRPFAMKQNFRAFLQQKDKEI